MNDFDLVQILIDSDDEPEMIFEALNGRGKALLQFDLLRNNLFLRIRISEGENRDELYNSYWAHFETVYWEQERKKVALSELFFQHFLMAKLASVSVMPLFKTYERQYRENLENSTTSYELKELHRYSKVYQDMTKCEETRIGKYMQFYKHLNITSLHPFILYFENEITSSESDREIVYRALESYTLRKLCTGQRDKNFNKFFSEAIKKLQRDEFSVVRFLEILSASTSSTNMWPSNDDVKSALNQIEVNNKVIRYILYRMELYKKDNNKFIEQEALPFKQFTLEHVLPQAWKKEWLLDTPDGQLKYDDLFTDEYKKENSLLGLTFLGSLGDHAKGVKKPSYTEAFERAKQRDSLLNSIGNLTILTGKLNSSLSNNPYEKKRESLFSNSTLILNKDIAQNQSWDLKEIEERKEQLCKIFFELWPDVNQFKSKAR